MTFKTAANAALGVTAFDLASVDVTPKVPVGTIAKAYDDTQGEGEFIYLPGAAGVAANDAVCTTCFRAAQPSRVIPTLPARTADALLRSP
jgi:hypothetical protein